MYITIRVKYHLLRRLLGVKADGDKAARVSRMRKGETLMVNIGSTSTSAKVRILVESDPFRPTHPPVFAPRYSRFCSGHVFLIAALALFLSGPERRGRGRHGIAAACLHGSRR